MFSKGKSRQAIVSVSAAQTLFFSFFFFLSFAEVLGTKLANRPLPVPAPPTLSTGAALTLLSLSCRHSGRALPRLRPPAVEDTWWRGHADWLQVSPTYPLPRHPPHHPVACTCCACSCSTPTWIRCQISSVGVFQEGLRDGTVGTIRFSRVWTVPAR